MVKEEAETLEEGREYQLVNVPSQSFIDSYNRLQKVQKELEGRKSDLASLLYFMNSGSYYFQDLPEATATAKMDTDGKFSLLAPSRGEWALAARGTRGAGSDQESYYWLVHLRVGGGKTSITLANDNLLDSGSADSLVKGSCSDSLAARGAELLPNMDGFFARLEQSTRDKADAAAAQAQRDRLPKMPQLVKESQARTVKAHPDLVVAGSEANRKFVEAYKDLQARKDPLLNDPKWPEIIVDDKPPASSPSTTAAPVGAVWNTPTAPLPAEARLSHLNGTVLVSCTSDASGAVSKVVVVKSSGNAILDRYVEDYAKKNWKGPPEATVTVETVCEAD